MKIAMMNFFRGFLRLIGHAPVPGATRLVNALMPEVAAPTLFNVDFHGLRFAGDSSDFVDRCIYYFGAYAPFELQFIDLAVDELAKHRNGIAFYDVGANSGQHSLYASRKASVAQVHAFEPGRAVADRFQHNVDLNRLAKVTIHRIALSEANGIARLGSGFSGNSGSRSLNWTLPGKDSEEVEVRAAGEYLDDLGLPRMDFLKLDVEGHERRVLSSLAARLHSDRPVIMMELIGDDLKSGFASEEQLRSFLYPSHRMLSLKAAGRRVHLTEFDWTCECAVVLPEELFHLGPA